MSCYQARHVECSPGPAHTWWRWLAQDCGPVLLWRSVWHIQNTVKLLANLLLCIYSVKCLHTFLFTLVVLLIQVNQFYWLVLNTFLIAATSDRGSCDQQRYPPASKPYDVFLWWFMHMISGFDLNVNWSDSHHSHSNSSVGGAVRNVEIYQKTILKHLCCIVYSVVYFTLPHNVRFPAIFFIALEFYAFSAIDCRGCIF